MTAVSFWFDVACPWTWITSRWVTEVAPQRGLDVTWNTFSLRYRNRDRELPEHLATRLDAEFRALRVIDAARAAHGNDAVARLYTLFGARIHHDGDALLEGGLERTVVDAGLPGSLADAGDDPSWDAQIHASTDAGLAKVGDDGGIPIVCIDGARSTFFGPVMSPAPTGDAAVALWDAFVTFGRYDGVYELKRTRAVGPQFGPRPH